VYIDSGTISVVAPPFLDEGFRNLMIKNPRGGSDELSSVLVYSHGALDAQPSTYSGQTPSLNTLSPAISPMSGTQLTLTGNNFAIGVSVKIGLLLLINQVLRQLRYLILITLFLLSWIIF